MYWDDIEPLKDTSLIEKYEQQIGYRFPDDFRQCVLENNSAYAEPDGFDTDKTEGRVFNHLFSFNPDDIDNIWDVGCGLDDTMEEIAELMQNYVTFASSPFGDPICFDRRDDSIVYVDHETLEVEYVAPSFQAFLDKLYSDEDE